MGAFIEQGDLNDDFRIRLVSPRTSQNIVLTRRDGVMSWPGYTLSERHSRLAKFDNIEPLPSSPYVREVYELSDDMVLVVAGDRFRDDQNGGRLHFRGKLGTPLAPTVMLYVSSDGPNEGWMVNKDHFVRTFIHTGELVITRK